MIGEEALGSGKRAVLSPTKGCSVNVILYDRVRPTSECPGPAVCRYSYDKLLFGTALLHPDVSTRSVEYYYAV